MTTSTSPEHDKLRAVRDKSQTIGEFLEWAKNRGGVLTQVPNVEKLLAEYFGLDLDKLEAERRARLDTLRNPPGL